LDNESGLLRSRHGHADGPDAEDERQAAQAQSRAGEERLAHQQGHPLLERAFRPDHGQRTQRQDWPQAGELGDVKQSGGIRYRLRIQRVHYFLVNCLLSGFADCHIGQPKHRVVPVEDLEQGLKAAHPGVKPFEVRQLMEKHIPQLSFGQFVHESGGNDDDGFPHSADCWHRGRFRNPEVNWASNPQVRLAPGAKVPERGPRWPGIAPEPSDEFLPSK